MVGHLDAHGRLAGDGCFHADIGHGKVQGDIIGQRGDAADLHARHGLDLIPGNGGAPRDIQHPGAHAEAFQRVHQLLGVGLQLVLGTGVTLLGRLFKQLDAGVLILEGLHHLRLLGRGGGGSLLACGGFFHGGRHQRVQVFFLHRFAGNADPAVLVRFTAHGHRVFRADPHRHHRLVRSGQGGGLEHRHLRLLGLCRCSRRGFRSRRRHGGVHHRGRSMRSGGREEILGGSLHGIRHHRFDDGPGRGLLERVLPKGAARPDDDGLNGLASALGNRGIRPKINIKRRAGMVGGHLDRLKGWGRLGGSRFRLHRRRRLVAQRIVHGSRFRFAFHLLGHLVAPAEHAGQPPGHRNAAGHVFLIGTVIVIVRRLLGAVLLFCLPGRKALSTAGGVLFIDRHAFFMHAAAHIAEPLPALGRGDIKDIQAGAQGQHRHDQIGRRPPAEQEQVSAQQSAQHAAAQPGVRAVLVAGSDHLGSGQVGGDIRKHDDRAAGKDQPQQQLEHLHQQVLPPGVEDGQIAHRRAQHKAAAAEQPE